MPPRNPSKAKPTKSNPVVPCQYDCGRNAEGSLSVSYYPNDAGEVHHHHWFSVTVPCCRHCLKAAIRVTIAIPEVAAKSHNVQS